MQIYALRANNSYALEWEKKIHCDIRANAIMLYAAAREVLMRDGYSTSFLCAARRLSAFMVLMLIVCAFWEAPNRRRPSWLAVALWSVFSVVCVWGGDGLACCNSNRTTKRILVRGALRSQIIGRKNSLYAVPARGTVHCLAQRHTKPTMPYIHTTGILIYNVNWMQIQIYLRPP